MTVEIQLSEDEAEKLADHLDKVHALYHQMYREAHEAGDRHAYSDFRAEAETAIDLRKRLMRELGEGVSDDSYTRAKQL